MQPREGTLFLSEPFDEPVDLVGRLRGVLDFTVNKYDVDLVMALYELRPDGEYVKLFDPAYAFRASYARDRVQRRLLMAGVRMKRGRFFSRSRTTSSSAARSRSGTRRNW